MLWADALYAQDIDWWKVYGDEARKTFQGELWAGNNLGDRKVTWVTVVDEPGLSVRAGRVHSGLNSGYQAVGLAFMWGAARIILVGFDMQRGPKGESHHHGDHEGGLSNLGTMDEWCRLMALMASDLRTQGVDVWNASRRTALKCFSQVPLEVALKVDTKIVNKPQLILQGMSGMGDNLHQRAVVKELVSRNKIWVMTPWPQIYHDLGVRCMPIKSNLRTQAKNEGRSGSLFTPPPTSGAVSVRGLTYSPQGVKKAGSVLGAIAASAGVRVGDFRLTVPQEWRDAAAKLIKSSKPLLIYRPLVARAEWGGAGQRNPDAQAYAALYQAFARMFYTVSVADFIPNVEWESGLHVETDLQFHNGELPFEIMAGLFANAAMVYSSPGFATVLAQAVGTPGITVFGGYEDRSSFAAGARFVPWLPIEPIKPCPCWSHTHKCDKRIDMEKATEAVKEFAKQVRNGKARRPLRPTFQATYGAAKLSSAPPRFFNPGELDVLVGLIQEINPETVIEFGCNEGRAAATIMLNVPSIKKYVGIDVLPGYKTLMERQRDEVPDEPGKYAKADPRFELIVRPKGAFDLKPEDLPTAQVAFIDADHSREGVLNDYALAKAVLQKGGIIIFHDDNGLTDVQVTETLDELHFQNGAKIFHVKDTWIAFERVE